MVRLPALEARLLRRDIFQCSNGAKQVVAFCLEMGEMKWCYENSGICVQPHRRPQPEAAPSREFAPALSASQYEWIASSPQSHN
jgi:hypothetical protein